MTNFVHDSLTQATKTLESFFIPSNIDLLSKAIDLMVASYQNDGKMISCGNGGSMCDAMHFAEELTGRYRKDRPSLAAFSISDPSHISCVANDYGYEYIFSRYIEGVGREGDVLLAISTSGNSPNVINACLAARKKKMKIVGLMGKDGGKMAKESLVDVPIIVSCQTTDRIQEVHIKCIHLFIEGIERALFPENYR